MLVQKIDLKWYFSSVHGDSDRASVIWFVTPIPSHPIPFNPNSKRENENENKNKNKNENENENENEN